MINIHYLIQFLELSQHKTMREYAKHSGSTPTQVSRMVMELEKHFSVSLLIRKHPGINLKLTEEGKKLLHHTSIFLDHLNHIQDLLQYNWGNPPLTFNLSAPSLLIDHVIAPNLSSFKDQYPHLILNLYGAESSHLNKTRGLTLAPFQQNLEGYVQKPLKTFQISLWASKGYVDRYGLPKKNLDSETLKHHFFLCSKNQWHEAFSKNIGTLPFNKKYTCVIDSSEGLLHAARRGMGLFLFPEGLMEEEDFLRIIPNVERTTLYLTYPAIWKDLPSIQEIESFLKTLFK